MTAKNDITGDLIATKTTTEAYRNNYDAIFGKKKKEEKKFRYFTHKDGFVDGTICVSVCMATGYCTAIFDIAGQSDIDVSAHYDLEYCLRCVANGSWIEIESPN